MINYYLDQSNLEFKKLDIKDIDYNFTQLKRKSFLFANIKNKKVKIFSNQESSNFSNIISSNCLVYYDKTKYLKLYYLND